MRVEHFVARADLGGERVGALEFRAGQTFGPAGHAERVLAQLVAGDLQHERGVHAAGECDDHALERSHERAQATFLDVDIFKNDHGGGNSSSRRAAISATGRPRSRAIRATSSYSRVRRRPPATLAVFTRTGPSSVATSATERSST